MKINFHIHSSLSDGKQSVEEILYDLKKENVELFSITDHDLLHNPNYKNWVNGVEITTSYHGYILHLLCYGNNDLFFLESLLCSNRKKRERYYFKLFLELKKEFPKMNRVEMPRVKYRVEDFIECIEASYNNLTENDYMKIYEIIYKLNNEYPSIIEVISLIDAHHQLSILAHPWRYRDIDTFSILPELLKFGLSGIEIKNDFNDRDNKKYYDWSVKNNLMVSIGSDYHERTIDKIGITINSRIEALEKFIEALKGDKI